MKHLQRRLTSHVLGHILVQRAPITDSKESLDKVREVQVHGSDQNEWIYITWLEIMFVISAKKSIAKMKTQEWKKEDDDSGRSDSSLE